LEQLDGLFEFDKGLKLVDAIFDRVFGASA
jgi:hypothetical protein